MKTTIAILALIVAGGIIGGMVGGDRPSRPHGQEWTHTSEVDQWAADNAH